jgi:hypothetical protein
MRILYQGFHCVLEFDELPLLAARATSIFSVGFYTDPNRPSADIRPPLELSNYNWEALEVWNKYGLTPRTWFNSVEFLKLFDVVIVVHDIGLLNDCIEDFPLPVVYRTIGQNDEAQEVWAKFQITRSKGRVRTVRYSPMERNILQYAGEDALIRFGKRTSDFLPRSKADGRVVSFCAGLSTRERRATCNYRFYRAATADFKRALYGSGNTDEPNHYPAITYFEQKKVLAEAGVYFCLGTLPASYTLNLIEAMAAGAPVVTIGRDVIAVTPGVREAVRLPDVYEVPDILAGAPGELVANTLEEARESLTNLLENEQLALNTGAWCRRRANELFGFEEISEKWAFLLNSL